MPPFVIPIFITHQGCPHRCVFCNQRPITGQNPACQDITPATVAETINQWLQRPRKFPGAQRQVAFYGGNFTGLPRSRQMALLDAVQPFLHSGALDLIRISTRPDCIDQTTAAFLVGRGVGIVELGIQSMDARVLAASRRGHSAAQVQQAVAILQAANLVVGAQLMVGLPGETTSSLLASAASIAALQPAFVRIYPTLVIRGTALARLYESGHYRPLSLNRAIGLCARIKRIFEQAGIRIIRMGLQPSAALEKEVLAGPYHPAFGELVLARFFFKTARRLLAAIPADQRRRLSIAPTDHSAFLGPHKANIRRLAALGLLNRLELTLAAGQPRQTVEMA